uniref:Ubiquitin carboxyl-terminal hydrolase n=1 Tax=Romanomermis culicivorax TaxID=13658 RepID=A0A915HZM8_ROMCU
MRGGGQGDCQSNNGFAGDDSTRRNFIFDSAPSTSGILAIEAPPDRLDLFLENTRRFITPTKTNTSNSDGTKIDESPYQGQSSSLNLRSDGYTGLVNQAMTCYLNSLLQTLFMTPEFRNAVYRWESVSKDDEAKSIPYQLQKLFLLLQTSDKPALETKDLTRSFGWDSSHVVLFGQSIFQRGVANCAFANRADPNAPYVICAIKSTWDQHDVQELCRVMFDALEHTWRKTSCAMIINDLYQGTIKDYVKCLEGLKITKFPYLLTIQLKRFDFDYTTLHRIKLNDRMTFPDVLNLNPFIDNAGSKTHTRRRQLDDESLETNFMERADYLRPRRSNTESSEDHSVPSVSMRNIDENGSPPQDPAPSPLLADGRTFKKNESDDEGICLDSASTLNGGSNVVSPLEPEANELDPNMINDRLDPALINAFLSEGPYVYELFSIMVHSGSANGGHYYAYIKNLDNKTWYCFNDQVVTRASVEDIRKTYGGTGMHFMYSYSSSTNAYMLMYRKIDPDQNEKFITSDNFPAHLIHMLKRLSSEEDQQRREEEYQKSLVEMTVNYYHPETGSLSKGIIKIPQVATVDDLIEKCIQEFQLASYGVAADRCRLVGFSGEKIEPVYDSSSTNKRTISHCNQQIVYHDLLLEIRPLHLKKFRPYSEDGVTIKISPIFSKGDTPSTSEGGWRIGKPFIFYAQKNDSVFEVKHQLAEFALWNEKNVHLVLYRYNDRLRVLDVMEKRFLEEVGGQLNPVSVYAIVDDASKFSTSEACSMGNDTHCSANILLQSQRLSILSNDGVVRSNAAFSGFGVGFPNTDLLHDPLPAPPPPPPPYSPKVAVSVKRRSGIVANNPAYEPPLQSMILQQYDTCTPAPSRSPTPEEPKVPPNHDMQSDFQNNFSCKATASIEFLMVENPYSPKIPTTLLVQLKLQKILAS